MFLANTEPVSGADDCISHVSSQTWTHRRLPDIAQRCPWSNLSSDCACDLTKRSGNELNRFEHIWLWYIGRDCSLVAAVWPTIVNKTCTFNERPADTVKRQYVLHYVCNVCFILMLSLLWLFFPLLVLISHCVLFANGNTATRTRYSKPLQACRYLGIRF